MNILNSWHSDLYCDAEWIILEKLVFGEAYKGFDGLTTVLGEPPSETDVLWLHNQDAASGALESMNAT